MQPDVVQSHRAAIADADEDATSNLHNGRVEAGPTGTVTLPRTGQRHRANVSDTAKAANLPTRGYTSANLLKKKG
jgi:hypothetical protein